MNKIMVFDLILLVLFCAGVFIFLYSRRNKLQREGIMYMYRTKVGMNAIERFGKNNSRLLNFFKYPIVVVGFALMIFMIYLLVQTVYIYVAFPQISQIVKAPPVMPLIPYFPQIFGIESFMPNFYFSYFIIALAIIAIVHEFSHGIYMSLFRTRIKSTGFVFLGPILGAFVEEDKKQFYKKNNLEQMTVLGAGVFANILTALVFFGLLVCFFYLSYSPAGYSFNSYAIATVGISQIQNCSIDGNFSLIYANGVPFVHQSNCTEFAKALDIANKNNVSMIALFNDAPAIRNNLSGAIVEIDGTKIKSKEDLGNYLATKKAGEMVSVKTVAGGKVKEYYFALGRNPLDETRAFLGVGNLETKSKNFLGKVLKMFEFRDGATYYSANYDANVADYIYYLIWWVMVINLFVGLFNMLPLGILDGGRFFYLAVLSLTRKESVAKKSFRIISSLIGLVFVTMIVAWIFSFWR